MLTGATLRLSPRGLKQYPNFFSSNLFCAPRCFAHDVRLSFQDEKLDATSRSLRLAALSSSFRGRGSAASDQPPCECLSVFMSLRRLLKPWAQTAWPLTCQCLGLFYSTVQRLRRSKLKKNKYSCWTSWCWRARVFIPNVVGGERSSFLYDMLYYILINFNHLFSIE